MFENHSKSFTLTVILQHFDRTPFSANSSSAPIESVNANEIPVMGRIAAGVPIEAISEISHNVAVPGQILRGGGDHFALEVKGDSMINAGINDGDVVVIDDTQAPQMAIL